MKCEVCHQADATEAIIREGSGEDDELYVCAACAKAAREHRQRKSSRTRKLTGLPPGVSMSVTEISSSPDGLGSDDVEGDEPPPIIGAIMNAFKDIARGLEDIEKSAEAKRVPKEKMLEFPATRAIADYRVRGGLHLEGLHLIGELDAVKRALKALGMSLKGITSDGVSDVGHVYRLGYTGQVDRAKQVVKDILREEKNARIRLKYEMQRVFGDSLCRALAILKNCRLLSPGELFDLLSPMRLAAKAGMLEGITLAEIEQLMAKQELSNGEDRLSQDERDHADAERADEMNRRFEEVMLNDVF